MAKSAETVTKRKRRAASTVEGRENQLVTLAIDLAEKQLREGTASSQVISHYLKLGTSRAHLEKEKLERENELLRAKAEAIRTNEEIERRYTAAMDAFRGYSGQFDNEDDYYEYEDY